MAKRVTLDVDSSIIEKNLLITEQDSCELDSLFPKQEENAILTKPLPVSIKMSDEVNLELKEQNNKNNNESDSNSSNLNNKNGNIITENLELKNSTDKKVNDDNITNTDNNSDNTDLNNQQSILIQDDKTVKTDNTEVASTPNSAESTTSNVSLALDIKQEVRKDGMIIEDGENAATQLENINNQNEVHDEIDITLEYDDVEDQLLNDGPSEEVTVPEEKPETKSNDINNHDNEEKNMTTQQNVEMTKTVENNENTEKQNQATLGRCLWVSGLSHTTRANDLKQHFVSQGRVIGAKVVSNSRSPGARCYGYIVMSTPEEADACVKNLHHSKLLNRFISVQKAKSDKQSDNGSNECTDNSPHKNVDSNATKSKKKDEKEDEKVMDSGDIATNEEQLKSESSTSIENKNKKDIKDASPKRIYKDTESTDKKHSKDSSKKRREPHSTKKISHDSREKKIDKYQRLREERDRERRINEERRIREMQRRQREEAARLDRERQMLRIERERLQREKMELLRLEKEQLEKEREELKRQKQKIEEANRKKHESSRSERSKKRRERSRSPLNRRSPDVSVKMSKKRELEKYKDDRHFGSIDKHKDLKYKESTSKDSYRSGGYKDRHDYEYGRPIDSKYDRYPSEKKDYKSRDIDLKTEDFMKNSTFSSKRNDEIGFEPPPPRISTNEANHFNVLPISHTTYISTSSNNRMLRDDFHNKDMFAPAINSSRSVDRVSDRFPIERHDRNENIDLNHRSRAYIPEMDCFPKQDTSRMVPPVRQDRLDRDNIRVNRDDRHVDSMPIRTNTGRYPEHERDFHHRDQWYMDRMGPSKRLMPPTLPNRGDGMLNRASWEAARYDQNIRPPGVYSSSIDRKNDRH